MALPDFPRQKHLLASLLREFLKREVHSLLGPFPSKGHFVHEGDGLETSFHEQPREEVEFETMRVKREVQYDELRQMDVAALLSRTKDTARKVAEQLHSHALKRVDEATRKAGTAIDLEGQGLTPEALMQLYEAIDIDFRADGATPQLVIVGSPKNIPHLTAVLEALEDDPALKRQFNGLLERKREEWRDREADRRLVD